MDAEGGDRGAGLRARGRGPHREPVQKVAINWCVCKGAIPIPGVKTVRHVEDNLGALGWRLSPDEISELEAAAMECPKKMVQNIFQTA
ncbi:unnamed protein product [Triticum turgidum subsp. durum]|uniref:NADP-dependent oxidoreductase domain-containing protein n=1 Tax=Triticum turgidum subsp. durum TaxID=4567 RepID=A0A9R0UVY9_TRITD|nr:unnamed protein product [Triticum turgidum subsp. durum]